MSLALLPGTCWMSHAMKATLRMTFTEIPWGQDMFLLDMFLLVHIFEYVWGTICCREKNIFASKECAVPSAVRCCQAFSVWRWNCNNVVYTLQSMGWCNVRRFMSIVMLRFLVTLGTWQCLWHSHVTLACGDCCRADCLAQWCLSFASCKRAGLGLVGLTTVHWAFFAHLSHTTWSQPLFHTQLSHTPSVSYNFVTSHTTTFYFSILRHLLCLSFLPRPRYNICCSLLEEVDLWGYPVL